MILYLQQFLYNLLNNDSINKKIQGIYFQVLANSYFPYIYIGDFNSKDVSTKDMEIAEIHFKLIIYTRDKSLKNMLELSEGIKRVLNINGKDKVVLMNCIEEKVSLQNDGVTHQISLKFRAIVVWFFRLC